MKKLLLTLGIMLLIVVSLWMFFFTPDKLTPENPAGKTIYYTMVSGPGVQNMNGRYEYKLTVYTEKGKGKEMEFSAGKQLRNEAYVRLYHTLLRGVTYWEEVTFEELPEAVQQKYRNIQAAH
ncbi:hypothetical protein GCM10023310_05860 [Paenibacillus vulneris]|uniref:YxeA family protein n=1 Tax=Paenibacillus vulneris TaxID=1133364 RepID=A0ABW3UPC8_9BACL|nr:YxeA family protein [Paenibacillus sp. 32352]